MVPLQAFPFLWGFNHRLYFLVLNNHIKYLTQPGEQKKTFFLIIQLRRNLIVVIYISDRITLIKRKKNKWKIGMQRLKFDDMTLCLELSALRQVEHTSPLVSIQEKEGRATAKTEHSNQ